MENKRSDNLNNFGNEPFSIKEKTNPVLTSDIPTLGHLRIYLQLKYVSLRVAGQAAGLSYSRMKQIVTGKYLPTTPELIRDISRAWGIDPIKLTQLFERCGK